MSISSLFFDSIKNYRKTFGRDPQYATASSDTFKELIKDINLTMILSQLSLFGDIFFKDGMMIGGCVLIADDDVEQGKIYFTDNKMVDNTIPF